MTVTKEAIVSKPITLESFSQLRQPDGSYIPHIQRIDAPKPPGLKSPDTLPTGEICERGMSDEIIDSPSSKLSLGEKKLLKKLLQAGGVAQFGPKNDYDLGIDYQNVYKKILDHQVMDDSIMELAATMEQDANERGITIDCVLAPEASGVMVGELFSGFLSNKPPCMLVQKSDHATSPIAVAIDSYSKGKVDVMNLPIELLEELKDKKNGEEINVVMFDDFFDSGRMTQAIALLLQIAREKGIMVNLVGIVVPIEKTYTGARDRIANEVGNMPIYSALKIEDLGIYEGNKPWIKVDGIDTAFESGLKDFTI